MSRHELNAKQRHLKVIVGWDPPLMTFFGQVIDVAKQSAGNDDYLVYWVGASFGEIRDANTLAAMLYRYAELSPAQLDRLCADQRKNCA
jgi:hypothetical protein